MTVTKRNGKTEKLSKQKIFTSICNANNAVEEKYRLTKVQIQRISDVIFEHCQALADPINIDNLEDEIERKLMETQGYEVAKRYITYRYEKERVRNNKAISAKLMASDVQNQNANVDEFSFGGRIGEAASYMMKEYALEHLLSVRSKHNHNNNEIYIHDLDHYAVGDHNCLSIPFDKLLAKGFNTRQTDVRPAGSINTAFQLVAVIFQLQSLQQFGGVSATHLDWTMVPYVRLSFFKHYNDALHFIGMDSLCLDKEDRKNKSITDAEYYNVDKAYEYALEQTEKELDQAVEGMYHNLNTLQSRSGNQLPFTSINFGTCTSAEGRMVIRSLLDGCMKGVGKFHRTAIFPCGIFQCMKGVNRAPGDPNYDLFRLALQSTAMRIYPNYANVDWSGNEGYDKDNPATYFSTMGCRTANGKDINQQDPKLVQLKDGRGNISPVTIILPTLAMQAKQSVYNDLKIDLSKAILNGETLDKNSNKQIDISDEVITKSVCDAFMKLLDKKINQAKDMLLERFDWQCSQSAKSAKFMYENGLMNGYIPKEGIKSALKHGTLAIGQLGLAEALQILIGCDHTDMNNGMPLAKEIEQLFKDRCAQFKTQYKLNFGVYYTPAENLCYTAIKKFRDKYGVIPKVSDHDWFTNSMHVPVWHKLDAFTKIDIESQLTGYSNAGCITYVELDTDSLHNVDALEKLVNYAMDKDIPYFAINTCNDLCNDCGYQGEIGDNCPQCNSGNIQKLRRVTGYITGDFKTAFNLGKQHETESRVKHTGVEVSENI